VPSFTDSHFQIYDWGPELKNGSRDPDHAHQGVVSHTKANT